MSVRLRFLNSCEFRSLRFAVNVWSGSVNETRTALCRAAVVSSSGTGGVIAGTRVVDSISLSLIGIATPPEPIPPLLTPLLEAFDPANRTETKMPTAKAKAMTMATTKNNIHLRQLGDISGCGRRSFSDLLRYNFSPQRYFRCVLSGTIVGDGWRFFSSPLAGISSMQIFSSCFSPSLRVPFPLESNGISQKAWLTWPF